MNAMASEFYRQLGLFVEQLVPANNVKVPYYWSFVSEIHWSPVVSPHKEPVMQRASPCNDAMMKLHNSISMEYRYYLRQRQSVRDHMDTIPNQQMNFPKRIFC